jgi:hypothetical protein
MRSNNRGIHDSWILLRVPLWAAGYLKFDTFAAHLVGHLVEFRPILDKVSDDVRDRITLLYASFMLRLCFLYPWIEEARLNHPPSIGHLAMIQSPSGRDWGT